MAAVMIVAPATLPDESFVLSAGEGTVLPAPFTNSFIKVRGEDTRGKFALIEMTIRARSAGPALHIHTQEDELFYMLDGALLLQLGTRRIRAAAGAVATCRRDRPIPSAIPMMPRRACWASLPLPGSSHTSRRMPR